MVRNLTKHTVVASHTECADTFWQRARGLLGRTALEPSAGLVIRPCSSVHMWGMRFPIDVIYVSSENVVVKCVPCLKPWRVGPIVRQAKWVLELPVGTIASTGTSLGDQLTVEALTA